MEKILIEEMSWTEFRDAMEETDLIIIPVGVTEQHGGHNPLGTDTFIAEACAKRIGEGVRAPVAAVLPYGYSPNVVNFPGSQSLDPELYRKVLVAYAESYIRHGARRFLFINGHGGNTSTLAMVCGDLFDRHGCIGMFNQWWEVLPALKPEWNCADHGGYFETSMMLAVNPGLVDLSKAKAGPVSPLTGRIEYGRGWRYAGASVPMAMDLSKVHKHGNLGNPPFGANAELGRKMMDAYVGFNVALAKEILKMGFFTEKLPQVGRGGGK